MGERLKNYLKAMECMLDELNRQKESASREPMGDVRDVQAAQTAKIQRVQIQRAKDELLIQITFFQHERLIHLIVTALFALLAMMVLVWVAVDFTPAAALLLLLLLLLLIPYIRHYYILENGTQKLYQYYDQLELLRKEMMQEAIK